MKIFTIYKETITTSSVQLEVKARTEKEAKLMAANYTEDTALIKEVAGGYEDSDTTIEVMAIEEIKQN